MGMATRIVLVCLVFSGALACVLAAGPRLGGECVDPSQLGSGVGSFPPSSYITSGANVTNSTIQLLFARNINVTYFDNYKVVTAFPSSFDAPNAKPDTYVLTQCGAPPPPTSQFPNGTKFFAVPLASVAVADTTVLGFMKLLGIDGRVFFSSQYSSDPCQLALAQSCNRVAQDPSYADKTLLAQQEDQTDAVFVSSSTNNSQAIAFGASADPGTLNRAEWIKYVSLFFNKEMEANAIFTSIAQDYNTTKQAAQAAANNSTRPLVAFLNYASYLKPAQVQISFATYKQQYIEDAGGSFLDPVAINATYGSAVRYSPSSSGPTITIRNGTAAAATLRAILKNVTVIVDETYAPVPSKYNLEAFRSTFGFTNDELTAFRAIVREDGVVGGNGGLAWLESALALPNQVLSDLVSILQPSALSVNSQPTYLRNLNTGSLPMLSQAKNCLTIQNCRLPYQPICPYVYRACNGTVVYATPTQRCAPQCPGSN